MQEERKWCVYCHTNKINGKKYIGTTKRLPHERWSYGKGYKTQSFFYNAIQKYGWDNFEHKILFENLTEEEASWKEKFLIKYYNTYIGNENCNGYNARLGGYNSSSSSKILKKKYSGKGNPMYGKDSQIFMTEDQIKIKNERISKSLKGRVFSEEHKQNIKNSKIGLKMSEESKLKRSKTMKEKWKDQDYRKKHLKIAKEQGEKMKGRIVPFETRQKISESNKGKFCRGKHKKAKKVICEKIIYECAKDCAEFYLVKYSTMISWLNGTNKTPKEWIQKGLSYYIEEEKNEM